MLISFEDINAVLLKYNITVCGAFHVGALNCEELFFYSKLCLTMKDTMWIDALPWKVGEARNQGIANMYNTVITDRDNDKIMFHVANNGESSSIIEFGTHTSEHPDVFYDSWMKCKCVQIDTFFTKKHYQ